MKILVTGASGFIGSFIVEEALRQGMETWAAVRPTSSKKYLQDERIHFINLNLSSKEELINQLDGQEFDYVVHAAGATKCLHADDFYKVNTEGTKNLVGALIALKMPIKRFVFVSSLSIFGAIREEQPYQEITEHDTPKPNTAYGKSKWETEKYLDSLGIQFPYIILRPTGVYGPREKDYFLMAKSIKQHVDFAVGYQRQDITFVYVQDVVQAVFLALDHLPEVPLPCSRARLASAPAHEYTPRALDQRPPKTAAVLSSREHNEALHAGHLRHCDERPPPVGDVACATCLVLGHIGANPRV